MVNMLVASFYAQYVSGDQTTDGWAGRALLTVGPKIGDVAMHRPDPGSRGTVPNASVYVNERAGLRRLRYLVAAANEGRRAKASRASATVNLR